ncbi:MAG TPA: hypothetical protein VGC99_14870, partial [Candidatus Tectomicrobia bacterium]
MPRFQPEEIFKILREHQIHYVLIGGLAATLHGSPLRTGDADICPESTPENLERLAAALREMKARIRAPDAPEGLPVPFDAAFLGRMEVLNLTTDFGDLDLQFRPAGSQSYDSLKRRALDYDLSGERVPTAYLGDVIRSKRAADRPKDHQTLPTLDRMFDMWRVKAQQGLSARHFLIGCNHCDYIAQSWEEADV